MPPTAASTTLGAPAELTPRHGHAAWSPCTPGDCASRERVRVREQAQTSRAGADVACRRGRRVQAQTSRAGADV